MSEAAPLIAFIGTTPNIGTTVAAFAAAYRIAEQSKLPVAYLCLHLKSSKLHRYLGLDEPEQTLDKLQPELRAFSLTSRKLQQSMYKVQKLPQLSVLFGNLNRDQAEFYLPQHIEHLLSVARQTFSVIIVDAGAYWDNAATICAMRQASTKIIATTSALSHFQEDGKRWLIDIAPLYQVAPHEYECLTITYPWKNGGFQMKQVYKEMNLSPIGQFQLTESMYYQLDRGQYEQWLQKDKLGKLAMNGSANKIMQRYRLDKQPGVIRNQPWYRRLIMHRNGARSS
ncbi:hypothetical protein [Paenibacillus sp. GXUN7292]|uniref:hypothetical protein n=1 Tax=Paenibacillus sp. GXUN7292 TaxID=3422499 RepID=UPI003D7DC180